MSSEKNEEYSENRQRETKPGQENAASDVSQGELPQSSIQPPVLSGFKTAALPLAEPLPDIILEEQAKALMAEMSLEEKVGQVFMPAIVADSRGRPILSVNEEVLEMINTVRPGGIILFAENFSSISQAAKFIQDLQKTSEIPLFIATDQEGGLVSRLSSENLSASDVPSQYIVGSTGNSKYAYLLGILVAEELKALGINMNMAPVADINTNPNNPVIGSIYRAYSDDPELTADMVASAVKGLQSCNLSSVLKHFPGHGDTRVDSHSKPVSLGHDLDRLLSVELVPFVRGIEAGVDGVMTGHISLPNVTGSELPATLSPFLLKSLLREKLGYTGLVISDSLTMGALTDYYAQDELAVQAFKAGIDLILRPVDVEKSFKALLKAVQEGSIEKVRLDESVIRILKLKLKRGLFVKSETVHPEEVLGKEEHLKLIREIYTATKETKAGGSAPEDTVHKEGKSLSDSWGD